MDLYLCISNACFCWIYCWFAHTPNGGRSLPCPRSVNEKIFNAFTNHFWRVLKPPSSKGVHIYIYICFVCRFACQCVYECVCVCVARCVRSGACNYNLSLLKFHKTLTPHLGGTRVELKNWNTENANANGNGNGNENVERMRGVWGVKKV